MFKSKQQLKNMYDNLTKEQRILITVLLILACVYSFFTLGKNLGEFIYVINQ